MFSLCSAFLAVSLLNSLNDFHVSSCDENCTEYPVFTPSRLVVKYGDPTSAECLVCQHACQNKTFGFKKSDTIKDTIKTTILWKVDSLTEWDIDDIQCYNTDNDDNQCCSNLPITLYQPPTNVSLSFINHAEPMFAGHEYKLQCNVQEVAPVGNLIVTFYRGQTELHRLQSNNTEKKPVNETFTLGINPSKEDDGEQYWCEAKLDLGAEGPQPPPVVESEKLTVYYKPQLKVPSHPEPITLTKGDPLQLNCSAVGNPRPSYNWTLPSASGSPFNDSVFTVECVTLEHKGQYTCSVYNDVGTVTVKFNVDVKDEKQDCTDKPVFTPSRLVVKFGDPASASCLACQDDCQNKTFGLKSSVGNFTRDGATISWKVDKMTEWDIRVINDNDDNQCCTSLTVTVYQPPKNVSFSSEPMFAGDEYKLQCNVQEVAPVGYLNVTFYRGQTELHRLQSNNTEKKPVNETFTLGINPSKEDDGEQYWCEAKLDLGAEGPQPPPVVESEKLTVYYKPQLKVSSHPDPVTVTEGYRLQLDCSAVGNPRPSYNWTLPSASGSNFNDSVFTIKSVTLEDKGQYICSVYNNFGAVTRMFNVHVKESYTVIILLVLSVVVLAAISFITVYCHKYKQSRKGRYNMKDVFHYRSQHVTGSTGELICE